MQKFINWILFIAMSLIWGSSFLLMKFGMDTLSPYQVASLRICSAGLILLPFAINKIKKFDKKTHLYLFLTGFIGNFLPAYLFCFAETHLDSAFAGTLNALTPILTLVVGVLLYNMKSTTFQKIGIFIGFIGLVFMSLSKTELIGFDQKHLFYTFLVFLATLGYAFNVLFVAQFLKGVKPIEIASIAFLYSGILALIVLIFTGYFSAEMFAKDNFLESTFYSIILGILNTALASYLFYILLQRAGAIFASMVTYGIPFVAVALGAIFKENISFKQLACLGLILFGVYLGSLKKDIKK